MKDYQFGWFAFGPQRRSSRYLLLLLSTGLFVLSGAWKTLQATPEFKSKARLVLSQGQYQKMLCACSSKFRLHMQSAPSELCVDLCWKSVAIGDLPKKQKIEFYLKETKLVSAQQKYRRYQRMKTLQTSKTQFRAIIHLITEWLAVCLWFCAE